MSFPPASSVATARSIVALALVVSSALVTRAQPTVSHALPGAVAPGQTTTVTLHGTKLDHPLRVWTSFPARVDVVAGDPNVKEPTTASVRISLPGGAPLGSGGIVVANAAGASEIVPLVVDDLPNAIDAGNNHDLAAPQDVQLPTAIDGHSDGTAFDYYRFSAKGGERVSLEVLATRLGWDLDAVVRVLDAAGNELARADDDQASAADPRLVFTAPADGQYVLEVRDNRYRAGGRYRIRLGDLPLVTTPHPLVAARGIASTVSFAGPQVEGIGPLHILAPAASPATLPFRTAGPGGSASDVSLLTTDLPVSVETSPGDDAATTAAAIPGVFAGQLEKENDRDTFEFAAAKGTAIQFRGISRSVGSAAVLMLRLQGSAGNPLAESPIGESDEPVLNFTFPEGGTYRLTVEDLAHRGGADFTYAIVARTGPQFSLALKTDPNNRLRHSLPAGTGALHLDVTCQRYAYDGPITLAIESPHHGWQLFNNVIPAKANEVRLYIVAPIDLSPAELAELRIVGRADDSGGNFIAPVSTLPQLRAARPFQPYPPAWQEGLILAMGAPVTPPFYTLSADRQEVNLARQVGETKLTLTFERTDPNFKDVPLTVLPLGLPAGIAAEVKRNNPGPKETYDVVLKGPKDMAEGVHSFRYFAFSEMGASGRSVQSGDVRLNVVTPLALALAPAGPLAPGGTQKVKLTVTRRGDDRQPVDVSFKALPPGVTAPEKTTLTADQNEVEVELTAAADAAAMNFAGLVATAASKYAGVDIAAESPAVALEVKVP
jgi:hypothetical protein